MCATTWCKWFLTKLQCNRSKVSLNVLEIRQALRNFAALGPKSLWNTVKNQRKKVIKTKQTADIQLTLLFGICIVWKTTVKHLAYPQGSHQAVYQWNLKSWWESTWSLAFWAGWFCFLVQTCSSPKTLCTETVRSWIKDKKPAIF